MDRMQALHAFAREAAVFRDWALNSESTGDAAAREALDRILAIYSAGLQLPPYIATDEDVSDEYHVNDAEWKSVLRACSRFPFSYYGDVFNVHVVPPDESGLGDLGDDIADIYREVVSGLRLYEHGFLEDALWEWGFGFAYHWGRHAVSAIKALHCYLAENNQAMLSKNKE